MNKKNIIGYLLIFVVIMAVLTQLEIIDMTNYADYEINDNDLSDAEPIKLESRDTPYCTGEDGFKPGFYDIKALGGSSIDENYSAYQISLLEKDKFINDIYISDNECILVDGELELIPSTHNYDPLGEQFEVNTTTDLIVGKNIEPGTYKVSADIPDGTSVFITSNNNVEIANGNLSTEVSNIKSLGLDNKNEDVTFEAKNNDVISFELTQYQGTNKKVLASFPVSIEKIK